MRVEAVEEGGTRWSADGVLAEGAVEGHGPFLKSGQIGGLDVRVSRGRNVGVEIIANDEEDVLFVSAGLCGFAIRGTHLLLLMGFALCGAFAFFPAEVLAFDDQIIANVEFGILRGELGRR